MKAKFINEFESGWYPEGSQYDRRAPWNEPDFHEKFDLDLDKFGYVTLIKTWDSGGDEGEDVFTIDPEKMDSLISQKLGITTEELENNGQIIEIYSIEKDGNQYKFLTNLGEVSIDPYEIEDLI